MSSHEDYRHIREAAAIGAIAPRQQIAVAGPDRATYLQGLLTNDIPALSAGTGCYSAWLTPQGRMLTDMHVLESGGLILLDLPVETADATRERLEQFIFTENVQVASLAGKLSGVWVHGPQAPAVVGRVLSDAPSLAAWRDYQHEPLQFRGQPISVARIDQLGVPGFCLYLEPSHEGDLITALIEAGAHDVSADAIDAARIEAGYPVFGVDMTDDTIPLEAGIEDRAISMSKGCYVGQEVIIRVLHRGQGRVARKLVTLRIDGPVPRRGTRLFAADRDVGFVTSAAASPRLGTIAMAYVHRDFVTPGTSIEAAADSGRVPATVTERVILSGA
ncbi:MAG TPA: glycine cleavage T C-terminal barrel domain-containing protein [Vicinamibacterales bacterium]|nr:glycine cleavage T C-terminal barrel domain-containing protein [Vicinamibacterales bacterium]